MLSSSPDTKPLFLARLLPSFLALLQVQLLDIQFTNPITFMVSWLLSSFLGYIISKTSIRFAIKASIAIFLPVFLYGIMRIIASDTFLLDFEFFLFLNAPIISWNIFFSSQSRSPSSLRFELIVLVLFLSLFFIINPPHTISLYQKPIILSLLIFIFTSSFLVGFGISWTTTRHLERKERHLFFLFSIILPLLLVLLTLRPMERNASKQGGGLIQPNLFSFDFAPIIKLQSEISMGDELVMLVHKPDQIQNNLTRRFVLSAYDKKSGFFMDDKLDSAMHPASLPSSPQKIEYVANELRRSVEQTYYIINFDSKAFMGINQPVYVQPYRTWNDSSFSNVFHVESMVNEAWAFELHDSEWINDSLNEQDHYLAYGDDERILALAISITEGLSTRWEKVEAINNYLREGDYTYSLKPGIAPDGNQLHYFLFDTKKGYCTYYAFSMTLLLRSLGIPARVAAGFILDEESTALSYYPVRSNMAHAWVEVWFKGYGWIEFDPTSTTLAEGEDFTFSSGIDPELFSRLIDEIQNYKDRLETMKEENTATKDFQLSRLLSSFFNTVFKWRLPILGFVYFMVMLLIRTRHYLVYRFSHSIKRKVFSLLSHFLLRLRFAGYTRNTNESLHAFISRLPPTICPSLQPLIELRDHVLFAPHLKEKIEVSQITTLKNNLRPIFEKHTHPIRRILSWIAPPLLLINMSRVFFLSMLIMFPFFIHSQELNDTSDSSVLLEQSRQDIREEFWDAAIQKLTKGKISFPDDSRFPIELGDLYSEKELYSLAWKEYQYAETLNPNDALLQYKLALTAGYLNQEHLSVSYFEKVVAAMPDDVDRHADLAWAYYKIHRAATAIRLLEEFESRHGETSAFYMTYGTLYADEKDFFKAQKYYERSIKDSQRRHQLYIESIARYNYSLVLNQFHYFEEAFTETKRSIKAYDRPSGRLAKGEMLIRQGDYLKAKEEFQRAYEYDKSPLSKMALADIFWRIGDLDQAIKWLNFVLNHEDQAWMYNYGTNINQHKNFLHSIACYIYDGLYKINTLTLPLDTQSLLNKIRQGFEYAVKAQYHKLVYKYYARNSAREFQSESMLMDAFKNYYFAYEHHSRRGLRYLEKAKTLEVAYIPQEEVVYQMEKALLLKEPQNIYAAMETLDPLWHRDLIIKAWSVLAENNQDAAATLFSNHPGMLLPNGISLPVAINIQSSDHRSHWISKLLLKVLLTHGGFKDYSKSRYELSFNISNDSIQWSLTDRLSESVLAYGEEPKTETKYRHIVHTIQNIKAECFTLK